MTEQLLRCIATARRYEHNFKSPRWLYGEEVMIEYQSIITLAIGIAVVVVFGYFIFVVGHVPSSTDYPHMTIADPSPYEGPCIDQQSLHDYTMTCSTLNATLQPGK